MSQIPISQTPSAVDEVCPICRTAVNDDLYACPNCHSPHHKECWDYNGGCGSYGCPSAPPTQKLTDMEVPPSFWGQSDKECPVCHNRIQAAALRCRHCGTVFSTARPQDINEFQQQKQVASDLPKLRRQSIVLLVLSIIPCTAALAAVGGAIWYSSNRRRLAALPAQQAAMPKIALAVASIQTIVLLVVIALHALLTHGS